MIKLKQLLFELSDAAKKKIKEKWAQENSHLTDGQMNYYIKSFEKFSSKPVFPSKDIFQYKFADLEKIVDANFSKEKVEPNYKDEFDLQNIDTYNSDLIYEGNNLVILLGDLRDKCIKYGKGYSWCISRKDSSNMFNSYRYAMHERIFYFVFDKDKPKTDPYHALVILVDMHNRYYVADSTNSKNTGSTEVDWNYITRLQPKLKDLKHLFKAIPLTDKQKEEYEYLKRIRSDEEYNALSYDLKEKYISVMYRDLSDAQYAATPDDLKNKYIQIGHELTVRQYKNSSQALKTAFLNLVEKRNIFNRLSPALKREIEKENPKMFIEMLYKGLDSQLFLKSQLKFAMKIDPQLLQNAERKLTVSRDDVIRNFPEPTKNKASYAAEVQKIFNMYREDPDKLKEYWQRRLDSRGRQGNWYIYAMLKTFPNYAEAYILKRYGAKGEYAASPYAKAYAKESQLILRTNINRMKSQL